MHVVDLEDPMSLPAGIQRKLSDHHDHFSRMEYLDDLREIGGIGKLIKDIDAFCCENIVIGYHYTRAVPEDILASGLLPRTGEQIRSQFLDRFGNMFSLQQISAMRQSWDSYFNARARSRRDLLLWFNFTKKALSDGGARLLLKYYGGEQIHFCIDEIPGVAEKLASIGQPLILRCKLDPNRIRTTIEYPWGSIAVSAYHKRANPQASMLDQDGRQCDPVSPSQIEIRCLTS